MTSLRTRQRFLAVALGLGLATASPAALAAENVVFISGAFRRSIPVADLEHLAATGQARGLLADVMRFSGQDPAEVARLLKASLSLPVVTVSRLLNTSIGERILERLSSIAFPLNARQVGLPALRSAVVLGIADNGGALSALSFLRSYPSQEMAVSLPALLAVMEKASSVAELVRFFSESPLDLGSREADPAPASPNAQATPAP
ncbi:MAG: alpha/beta hydrolase [Synechococcaceae cyanobacterium]|nr:alpha/beta hydrolase [Synechococcaceae cyanobacterium]